MVELQSNIKIDPMMLLLLLCVAKGSSSPKLWEADDSNRISTLQGKPNTHVWNNIGSFPNNRLLFFPACGQSHSPRLQGTNFLPYSRGVDQQ